MPTPSPTQSAEQLARQTAWHAAEQAEVLARLDTTEQGLSSEQARARLAEYGANRLPGTVKRGLWQRFLAQCNNVLILVLAIAAGIVLLLGHWVDGLVISAVILINALIGMVQEGKAEDAIAALGRMLTTSAVVKRNNSKITVSADELVAGDLVFFQAGDKVPADVRLLWAKNLQLQEAVLTGESMPVAKTPEAVAQATELADRQCMLYSGTLVTYGQASGVVVATGTDTELGRISSLLSDVQTIATPLLTQIALFSRQLSVMIVLIAILTLLVGIIVHQFTLSSMFIAAVSVAVAAIPEGLPAIMTITLAIGVQKMAGRKAIIRNLPAVETLGSVTVICTDKTGTLTRNEMTVTAMRSADEHELRVTGSGYDPHGDIMQGESLVNIEQTPMLQDLIRAGLLCNDARLLNKDGHWLCEGDPTEGALLSLAAKAGLQIEFEKAALPRIDVIPFESEHQFMATLHHDHQGRHFCYLKGAPERVLEKCRYQQDGKALDLQHWQRCIKQLASQGQRVLALARLDFDGNQNELNFTDVEHGLTLLGLVAMMDPPREDAIQAIRLCQDAGIKIKMITGDHSDTAAAIAGRMGMNPAVISGHEIEQLDESALRRIVNEKSVFARATPEHKLKLVKALQQNEEVVAMTGDGVNDAPALKRADIGTAMGINGTEVARDAADMVLADDNFASIVDAVEEGRTVYDNLTKAILFILPTSAGEALIIIAAIVMGVMLPITPVQILWINMITAVTLGLALAFEPAEPGLMARRPRERKAPLLTAQLIRRITFVSVVMMLGSFSLFLWHIEAGHSLEVSRTVAVNTLVMFEVFYLFNTRFLNAPVLNSPGLLGNRVALLAVVALLIFQSGFTYLPFMQFLFGSAAISGFSWLLIVVTASLILWLVELEKWILRRHQRT
jgi:magnesium-transporting ATPase (P-type)